MEITLKIPQDNLPKLVDLLEEANKKASKLGVPPLSYSITSQYEFKIPSKDLDGTFRYDHNGSVIMLSVIMLSIIVHGDTPKLAGWSLIAAISHDVAGSQHIEIIRTVPGELVPPSQRDRGNICDHCGYARRRSETFVLRNESGQYMVVGRKCVSDFLGSARFNPATWSSWLSIISELHQTVSDDDDDAPLRRGVEPRYPLQHLLELTSAVIKHDGWLSSKAAQEQGRSSSASTVRWLLDPAKDLKDRAAHRVYTDLITPQMQAESALSIEWAASLPGVSDYEKNIKVLATIGSARYKDTGFAASILPGFRRAMERSVDPDRIAFLNDWVGRKGDKIGPVQIKVLSQYSMGPNRYNRYAPPTVIYRMVTSSGHVLTWFCSSGVEMEKGQVWMLRGTVKDQGEYKGRKETIMTRCKVEKAMEPQAV